MALGSNHQTTTTAANFIPELWSDEVIAGYKKNLVLGNLVTSPLLFVVLLTLKELTLRLRFRVIRTARCRSALTSTMNILS